MVVLVVWVGLAVGAEVLVVADGTLIAGALNVLGLVLAEWTVAEDADVTSLAVSWGRDWFVEGREAMTWVNEGGVLDALRAVVPVWAVQALVTGTEDWLSNISNVPSQANQQTHLVASIAQSIVLGVAARGAQELGKRRKWFLTNGLELVSWVMTMVVSLMAWDAKIVIWAIKASHEFSLFVLCCQVSLVATTLAFTIRTLDAAVASASSDIDRLLDGLIRLLLLGVLSEGTRHLRKCGLGSLIHSLLWRQTLRGAAYNLTILDKALDQPVVVAWAVNATVDARLAEIVVALIADVAVVVGISHGLIALVAEDGP